MDPINCNCCGTQFPVGGLVAVGYPDSNGHMWQYNVCPPCVGCGTDLEGQPEHKAA